MFSFSFFFTPVTLLTPLKWGCISSVFCFVFQPRKCLLSTRSGGSWLLLLWLASSSSSYLFSSSSFEARVKSTQKRQIQVGNATDHQTLSVFVPLKLSGGISLHLGQFCGEIEVEWFSIWNLFYRTRVRRHTQLNPLCWFFSTSSGWQQKHESKGYR